VAIRARWDGEFSNVWTDEQGRDAGQQRPEQVVFLEKASALAGQSMRIVTRIGRNARKHA
jgi:hypothetical protein